jgi:hypothetical protein
MWCTRTTIDIYYNKLQKNLLQNSFVCKKHFGKKYMQYFHKIIMLAHWILLTPNHCNYFIHTLIMPVA